MKRSTVKAALVCTLLLGPVSAQEERVLVGKVIDIDGPRLYTNRLTDKSWYQGYMGMVTFLRERLRTDPETQAVLSFLSGGRAGLGRNSRVEIVSTGSVADEAGGSMRIDAGTFWAKFDKQEKPFQIKTAGGVIGIEGTELLVGVEEETGVTEVLLFEGQVTVTDDNGNEKLLLPGDYLEFGGSKGMCTLSYPPASLRTLVVERFPEFSSFLAGQEITSIPQPASPTLVRGFNPKQADLLTVLASSVTLPPEGTVVGLTSRSDAGPPSFSWAPFAEAESYAFYLTADEALENILFSSRVEGSSFQVPKGAQGLAAGTYHWAVIPLDPSGAAMAPPARAALRTPGWASAGLVLEENGSKPP